MTTRTNAGTRDALDSLISAVNDELLVLESSERIVESSLLRDRLRQQARRRRGARTDLSSALAGLGGSPSSNAGWRVRLAHAVRSIARVLAGAHQGDILAACARATAKTERSYWNALNEVLPPNIRSFVEPQYQQTSVDLATLRRLRWGGRDTVGPGPIASPSHRDGLVAVESGHEDLWQDVDLREFAASTVVSHR